MTAKQSQQSVEQRVVSLAQQGYQPSQIGMVLRDEDDVHAVNSTIGKSISDILEENDLLTVPEDLQYLQKKAQRMQNHLELNEKDHSTKHELELTNAHIRRLAAYYKRQGTLPRKWRHK